MTKKKTNHPVANLRLLQSADMFSGQSCSLDMIAVDLESEFQIVPSPDKSSVDSPPAKAACRYRSCFKSDSTIENVKNLKNQALKIVFLTLSWQTKLS
jgi:hypothetical protein